MFTTHAFFFFFYVPFFPSGLFHNDYDTAAVDSCCFVVLRCTHARTNVETVLVILSTQLTPSPLDLSGNRGGRHHHFYHYHPSNDEQHMCICARSRADSMNCHEGPPVYLSPGTPRRQSRTKSGKGDVCFFYLSFTAKLQVVLLQWMKSGTHAVTVLCLCVIPISPLPLILSVSSSGLARRVCQRVYVNSSTRSGFHCTVGTCARPNLTYSQTFRTSQSE